MDSPLAHLNRIRIGGWGGSLFGLVELLMMCVGEVVRLGMGRHFSGVGLGSKIEGKEFPISWQKGYDK